MNNPPQRATRSLCAPLFLLPTQTKACPASWTPWNVVLHPTKSPNLDIAAVCLSHCGAGGLFHPFYRRSIDQAGPRETSRGRLNPSRMASPPSQQPPPTCSVSTDRPPEGSGGPSCLPPEQGWKTPMSGAWLSTANASTWYIIDGASNCAFPKVYRPLMKNSWHARGWEQIQSIGSAAGSGAPGPSL